MVWSSQKFLSRSLLRHELDRQVRFGNIEGRVKRVSTLNHRPHQIPSALFDPVKPFLNPTDTLAGFATPHREAINFNGDTTGLTAVVKAKSNQGPAQISSTTTHRWGRNQEVVDNHLKAGDLVPGWKSRLWGKDPRLEGRQLSHSFSFHSQTWFRRIRILIITNN